ncbi:response regulator [Opitutus terrae]|uniref:Response regulator receiver protein n=1 Tax=Opitutus terrae (strain DSM 11246 / JCM 15787 / PB90-1) TaxID=452637 RepID=B1ZY74_OPITP|nr:response regulator [Opitutus terrae]ACB76220.1 response regulator receiver protein [Opitutus terrae PB90-1]
MKAKVLIVDDSALARRTLRQMLEELGHTVEEASDGAQALERFYLSPPDLVILDMVMAGMYGLDVLSKMREMKPDAKIIVATADIQVSTAEMARKAGAKAVLNKPINRPSFAPIVKTVLEGGDTWN